MEKYFKKAKYNDVIIIDNYTRIVGDSIKHVRTPVLFPDGHWYAVNVVSSGYLDPPPDLIAMPFDSEESCKEACDHLNRWNGWNRNEVERIISASMKLSQFSADELIDIADNASAFEILIDKFPAIASHCRYDKYEEYMQTRTEKTERIIKSYNSKGVIKLDTNFHVYLHGAKEKIEHGFDENGSYIKLYYNKAN